MQPWTRPSRCRGDTRTHCKWWRACWVSSKRTGTIHKQRTQVNVLEVKSQELEVEHCHSELYRIPQNLTFPQSYVAASLQRNADFLCLFILPGHILSAIPLSLALSFLVIGGGWEATNLAPSTPEVLHSLWSASSLCFLRTLPLYTVWI